MRGGLGPAGPVRGSTGCLTGCPTVTSGRRWWGPSRPHVLPLVRGRLEHRSRSGMKLGLHIADFTWDGCPAALRQHLGEVARGAEQAGYDRVSVMDHVWQIGHLGPPEHEMLEAYTALGYLAAVTERVKLLTVVTAVVYREPGLLAKAVTTLDVLSGGRAMLGIGAAWNEEGVSRTGLVLPLDCRAFRAVGGGLADLQPDVERQRRSVRRQALPARTDAELASGTEPSPPAGPHRRR